MLAPFNVDGMAYSVVGKGIAGFHRVLPRGVVCLPNQRQRCHFASKQNKQHGMASKLQHRLFTRLVKYSHVCPHTYTRFTTVSPLGQLITDELVHPTTYIILRFMLTSTSMLMTSPLQAGFPSGGMQRLAAPSALLWASSLH